MKRSGIKRGTKPMKRSRMKRRPTNPERGVEFSDDVKGHVRRRSSGRCEARCTKSCHGVIQHFHHRLRRSQGGKGTIDNCLGVCRACHDHIHANVTESFLRGWLIRGTGPLDR